PRGHRSPVAVLFREPTMSKTVISTDKAPAAIGTYSQAIKAGDTVYLSGQIPLDPATMQLVEGFEAQAVRVFENLKAVAEAAGGTLNDIVKRSSDRTARNIVEAADVVRSRYFRQPQPARAAAAIGCLPRGWLVEMYGVVVRGRSPPGTSRVGAWWRTSVG